MVRYNESKNIKIFVSVKKKQQVELEKYRWHFGPNFRMLKLSKHSKRSNTWILYQKKLKMILLTSNKKLHKKSQMILKKEGKKEDLLGKWMLSAKI